MQREAEHVVAYAARCGAACALAYGLAYGLGFSQPIWAAMSAVIVSQDRLSQTRATLASRIAGTVVGVLVSLPVGEIGAWLHAPVAAEMAVAVALAALVADWSPNLRVAMWTCPIVLLSAGAQQSLLAGALQRASEVSFGAVVGWALHGIAERAIPWGRRG